jgi:hypothetical protein
MIGIYISNIDKSSWIDWKSFEKVEVLTKEVDRFQFDIRKTPVKSIPDLGDEVKVYRGAEKIFHGIIVEVSEKIKGGVLLGYQIKCKDWTQILDKQLVIEQYTNQTAEAIVQDIITAYCPGFTANNVDADINVPSIKFNYEQVSKCLQQLADLLDYDWYVDYDKDIHFFSEETYTAPFELDDSAGNYRFGSLEINKNILQVKNSVYVRGGEKKETDPKTYNFVADGQQVIFYLPYQLDEITVVKGGATQSIGTDNLTDPNTVDCLYNFNEKIIKFRNDNKPASGSTVAISGKAWIPIIKHLKDNESINSYGEYQFAVIDKTISTDQEAINRGKASLKKFNESIYEASFKTKRDGLKTGQRIRIQSNIRGVNKWFKINRITSRMRNSGELEYEVFLIASGDVSFVDMMTGILERDKKNIDIKVNEVLDKIETIDSPVTIGELIIRMSPMVADEIVSIGESITAANKSPNFKWMPDAVNPAKWNLFQWI